MENNTNAPLLRSHRKYSDSDYDVLVPDDPKPIKYNYKDPNNAPGYRRKGTKTCTKCHEYKNGTHSVCAGRCKSIDTCPTEYFTSQKGHVEIEHEFLRKVNERAKRIKAWVIKINEEQDLAKSAYTKEKEVFRANEMAKQQELHKKTHFSMPNSLVPKPNGKFKNPEGLAKAVSLTLKRKIEEYNSEATNAKRQKITQTVGAAYDYAIGVELESDADISVSEATEMSVAESDTADLPKINDVELETVTPKRRTFKSLQERRAHEKEIEEFEKEVFLVDFTGITDLEEFDNLIHRAVQRRKKLEYLINY